MANIEVFRQKFFRLTWRCLLTEYVLSTSFILITLLHNAVRKFGTFLLHHLVLSSNGRISSVVFICGVVAVKVVAK